MRYSYNMTFLVSASRRAEQTEWIQRRVELLRRGVGFTGLGASLSTVVAVPGISNYGQEETSLTAQFDFESLEAARLWGDPHFVTVAGAYAKSFGSQAYVMPSIIETHEIK